MAAELGLDLREKIYTHRDEITRVEELQMEDAEVAIFAYGSVARSAKAALKWARAQGVRVGLVRPLTLWPFPTTAVEQMAAQVRSVIVPEMNLKQISWEVQAAVAGRAKVVDYGRVDGQLITPEEIQALIVKEFHYHRWVTNTWSRRAHQRCAAPEVNRIHRRDHPTPDKAQDDLVCGLFQRHRHARADRCPRRP